MSNYKDTMVYKLYKRAEENLESGVAVNNLVDKILKEVIKDVDFGKTMARVDMSSYGITLTDKALEELKNMGFKVFHRGQEEFAVIWDFSKEDAKKNEDNTNEN